MPMAKPSTGEPYFRIFLDDGVLRPGEEIVRTLRFDRPASGGRLQYRLKLLSGQGNP